jgi:parallel beta-helix repeat protein
MELCQARHKLLIFDCCHAGAAKGGRTYDQMRVEELFDARSNQLIFASDRFERAREFEEYRGSFLAHGIAEALRNRLDTSISASYLVDSLRRKAFEHNRLPQPPVPIPFIFGQHSGDFVLASAMGSEDAAVSLVPSASPQTTLAAAPSGEILVGAGEDCQFASLADALVECVPQSRLVLRAGVYQGNVHVDIPIEIHAAEGNDKVELRGSIHISGDCHFRGVTIRNDSAHVVTVDRGTVSFLDCKIYGGESHACMKALTHSRLKLRNVCFEGGAFGLIVAFHAHAVVDTCEFALHGVGIIVDRGAEITVNSSILRDCNKIGIDVRNRGRAVIQKVIVDNNRDIGVEATGNSNANIGNSTIRRNGQGVRFEDNSTGEVIGNEITENTMSGIHVATNSSPTVRENSIRNNASDGVIVFSNGRGLYEKNKISNNGAHGFDIQGGSHIRIRRNHIFENQGAGLRASEESQVEAESDEIYLNSNNGIDAQEGARVALSSCIVNNNRGC